MEPEKPPRRQTSDKTPTTIDLTADRLPSQNGAAEDAAADTAAAAGKPEADKVSDIKPANPAPTQSASTVLASDAASPADKTTDKGADKVAAKTASDPLKADPLKAGPSKAGDPLAAPSSGAQAAPVRAWDRPSDLPGASKPGTSASTAQKDASAKDDKAARTGPASTTGSASTTASSSVPPSGATATGAGRSGAGGSNGSGAKGLAAGILGGLIVLIGAGALQYGGILPSLSPDSRQNSEEIEALRGEIARVEQGAGQITALKGTVDALQAQIAALRQADDAMTARVEAAERKAEAPTSEVQLARAVAVAALKTAIDRGGPFQSELEAAKAVNPDEAALGELSADASGGLPSRRELVDSFPAVADRMLSAVRTPGSTDGGFLTRLMGSAESLVRMRPVGDPKGNEPADIVARIENRLSSGDLRGAQAEWQGLPEAAQAAGKSFKDQLDQRLRVEEIVGRLMAGATAAKQG
ncbi:hypothetical protein BJF92_20525 [Rhizobium rhizosphaerae]|uniref:Inner membrane protein n=1 Tax=Xaviernesmea rhizosphaerae TaxID=1672749 RepID=A0A1Q9ALQ4_9HYPH|nr:hypothetical protein [Xaviernesmea rhizosphaerae]OLP56179.1 hypothetical protein BJF92_20525 [Xaviernesmea rhizosphaerae]